MSYGLVQRETASGKDLERELLERVTARMKAAKPEDAGGLALLLEALRTNRNIWLTFAADLANPGNRCSAELKASIISIAGFVERSTAEASRNYGILQSLIEINESIIAGLKGPMSHAPRMAKEPARVGA